MSVQRRWSTPGKHLPHCPHCGAFVSPKTGVCNASRCSKSGEQVTETIDWPPVGVQFTNDRSKWGNPVSTEAAQPSTVADTDATADVATSIDWDRIVELEPKLRQTAWHIASRTGGDADELFSVGQMAVIEKAQVDHTFLAQKDAYVTTFASWRMRSHLNPRWAEKNAVPLDDLTVHPATSSFENEWLTIQALVDQLDDEELEIIRTIIEYGDEVTHDCSGELNVSALARAMDVPQSTMSRRVSALQAAVA